MEIRAFNFEVRASENEEHGHFLEGRPIVYDERTDLGWHDEIIERGALADTDLKDVRFLVNHNTDMIPLARSRNNNANSTMQMEIDDEGMKIRVDLDTENNSEAKALYSAVSRGDISGMSFILPSIMAALALGPKQGIPFSSSASTQPNTRGSSGATTA